MNMKMSIFLVGISILLFMSSSCSEERGLDVDLNCHDCNIILVTFDVLRAKSMPCYGYHRNTTPFICSLSNHGFIFDNAFTPAPNTLPAHVSLMTGLNPAHHSVLIPYKDKLPNNIEVLPMSMVKEGYSTVWTGYIDIPQLPYEELKGAFTELAGTDWYSGINWIEKNPSKKFFIQLYDDHLHSPYTPKKDSVIFLIKNELEDKPFLKSLLNEEVTYNQTKLESFAILNITRAPAKYFPPEFLMNYSDTLNSRNESKIKQFLESVYFHSNSKKKFYQHIISFYFLQNKIYWSQFNTSNKEDLELVRTLYEAEILEEDLKVKKLFEVLKQKKLLNKTIVIIISDHGEEFYEHGQRDHFQLYDEIVHIPLIIYHPKVHGRVRVRFLTQIIDVLPTVFSMVGVKLPKIEGKNLLPYISRDRGLPNEYVYLGPWHNTIGIRTPKWKYLSRENGVRELYNLENDPLERNNVLENYPEVVRNLSQELKEYFSTLVENKNPFPDWINESKREKLIKTGYW